MIQVKPSVTQDVRMDQIKPDHHEVDEGPCVELFHSSSGYKAVDTAPDEWDVKDILRHRVGRNGKVEFETVWEGADPSETTWEPAQNFVPRYCYKFVEYLQRVGLDVGLVESPSATPGEHILGGE